MRLLYLYPMKKVPKRTADIMLRSAVWSKAFRGDRVIIKQDMDPQSDILHVYEIQGVSNGKP